MSAVFQFCEDNGASLGGTFARGTTRTTGVTNCDWKNEDSTASNFASVPITAGDNSYTKYQFGVWTGTWNEIRSGYFQHTYGALDGTYYTLHARCSGSGLYETPSKATNNLLIHDITNSGSIATGLRFGVGINGPEWSGKSHDGSTGQYVEPWGATLYSDYFATQLRTSADSPPGNLSSGALTLSVSWIES